MLTKLARMQTISAKSGPRLINPGPKLAKVGPMRRGLLGDPQGCAPLTGALARLSCECHFDPAVTLLGCARAKRGAPSPRTRAAARASQQQGAKPLRSAARPPMLDGPASSRRRRTQPRFCVAATHGGSTPDMALRRSELEGPVCSAPPCRSAACHAGSP